MHWVPRPGFGKNCPNKVFAPFFGWKKSPLPYFFPKKKLFSPLFLYFLTKPALNAVMKTSFYVYFIYHTPMNTPESLDPTYITFDLQKIKFLDFQIFYWKSLCPFENSLHSPFYLEKKSYHALIFFQKKRGSSKIYRKHIWQRNYNL